MSEEKSLLEEELHKINEDIRQKQAEVEGTLQSSFVLCQLLVSLILLCKLLMFFRKSIYLGPLCTMQCSFCIEQWL